MFTALSSAKNLLTTLVRQLNFITIQYHDQYKQSVSLRLANNVLAFQSYRYVARFEQDKVCI